MSPATRKEPSADRLLAAIGRAGFAIGWARAWLRDPSAPALAALSADLSHLARDLEARFQQWSTTHFGEFFALLRVVRPILTTSAMTIVTRFDDVEEVLARDRVFRVPYADAFTMLTGGGSFLLGMDGTPAYARDASTLQKVARREDIETMVIPIVSGAAQHAVGRAAGRIDVVTELGEVVLTELVTHYFGTPSPTPGDYATWSTDMSTYLFLQMQSDQAMLNAAETAGQRMRAALEQTIATRKEARGQRVDILERLLTLQDAGLPGCDDVAVRNMLLGLVVAAIPTTAAAAALVVDELLRRPEQLVGAQAAARANDDRALAAYAFEALRLNPLGPGVFRVASEDYEIASGTLRATRIRKGTRVLAALQSAMMDERAVDHPRQFRLDRKPYQNLVFGYGLHTCFGRYINAVQIPLIVKPLLAQRRLRRADGPEGTLTRVNSFPASLVVQFE